MSSLFWSADLRTSQGGLWHQWQLSLSQSACPAQPWGRRGGGAPVLLRPSRPFRSLPQAQVCAPRPLPLAMTGQVGGADFGGVPSPSAHQNPWPQPRDRPVSLGAARRVGGWPGGHPGYRPPDFPSSSPPGRGSGTPLLGCSGPKHGQSTGDSTPCHRDLPVRAARGPSSQPASRFVAVKAGGGLNVH